jgi:Protein of unknown function (DUF4435)
MRDSLSVDRDVNSIRLRRSTFSGTFVLVEGSSDRVFYERFFDRVACSLISLSGKPSSKARVIAVLSALEESNFQGILALADADFDRLKTSYHDSPNLIRTDTHDLETMLLNSPALEKLLAEFGSEEKIGNLGRDVRSLLLETAMTVGYLRWISQIDELNLTFDGITFSKFVDDQILKIDEDKFIQEVKNKSQAFGLKNADLKQRLADEISCNHDLWQVCCGHDLVEILSLSLRKTIGSAKASSVEPTNLERSLRLAYEETYFHKTQIYLSILAWEINNQSFQVFQLTS